MKQGKLTLLILLFSLLFFAHTEQVKEEPVLPKLDFTCTICVILANGLIHGVSREREALKRALQQVCNIVPRNFNSTCVFVIRTTGDFIIDQIMRGDSPSKICNSLSIFNCKGCSLQNKDSYPDPELLKYARENDSKMKLNMKFPPIHFSQQPNPRVMPTLDNDKDFFSPTDTLLRSAHWRGRDCNDRDPNVKPGAIDTNPNVDMDCNGITGRDEQGRSYEDLWCKNSEAKSVLIFGDSGTSAFHLPRDWLFFQNMSNIIPALQNEFDWPQYSWGTGYEAATLGKSIYSYMRERNRCNHRQYQNIGFNGGKMSDFMGQIRGLSMSRDSKPYIAFASYIGNDVCKRSLDMMTKPEDSERDLLRALNELDKISPKGSKIMVTGMVDGRILWEEMGHRKHPFGVPYKNVYNFLDCTDANPCKTWLTSNDTLREAASKRAEELSATSQRVIKERGRSFQNIEVDYTHFPLKEALEEARRRGIGAHKLIEEVDGFHPSHDGQKMFAEFMWKILSEKHPEWLGKPNPFNEEIIKKFGNQGGH